MANPDDPDFDEFVLGIMDATFSSAIDDTVLASDIEDNLLHNVSSEGDSSEEGDIEHVNRENEGRPRPSTWSK